MFSEATVAGDWVHSHEEDSGNLMVFRPAGIFFVYLRASCGL